MIIHQVAKATGLTIPTIRYYEQEGLIDTRHVMRSPNGYRSYTEDAVKRLLHLKQARAVGLTLAEVKMLTRASDNGALGTDVRREFLCGKIAALSDKISTLEAMREGFELELKELV